jgi:hypothetical protein
MGRRAGDRVETQLGECRRSQILLRQGRGFTHPRERLGEFAADASDEVGRRGLLQEDLAGSGEKVWYYSASAIDYQTATVFLISNSMGRSVR